MISSRLSIFYVALGVAIALRVALIPNPGFEADVSFWKSWGLAVLDHGVIAGLPLTNFNYPTPFAYVLGVMAWIYRLFADPHTFNEFWNNSNLLFLAVSKAFPILADLGIAGIFVYIGRHAKKLGFPELRVTDYGLLAIVYLLSPIALIDGAWWGQIDSVGVFLFLLALLATLHRFSFLAGVIFMVAMMTKLQNMIYGPVFFLFIWQYLGFSALTKAIAGATLTFIGLNIEFILAKQSWRIIASIVGNYDYFPWISLNAYNPWWIFSGAAGMQMSDKVLALGIMNAKTVGLLTFASMYLFAVLKQFTATMQQRYNATKPHRLTVSLPQHFMESLIIVNAAFFLFQTQSHERYAFPLSVFLLLWSPFFISNLESRISNSRIKLFAFFYSLFTIVYFYNLHTALIINYPNNGIALLSTLNTPTLTLAASAILTGLFGIFITHLVRASRGTGYWLLVTGAIFISALLFYNKPLFTKEPVALSSIAPLSASTGYGSRQVDMPAVSGFGIDKWQPLSVQYAFYTTGIGTHAPARETYDIGGKFRTLKTDMGVDTNGGPQGSVTFEIWGDGKKLFDSGLIKRFELPRHADVDITGVNTLELVVTDGGNGNVDDHADWLNTTLYP
jgi:Gpi18-like mannosyltransferase